MRVGAAQHFLVESEALGDRERVGRAGQPKPQAEGRPQRVRVELHACVPHAGRVEREGLELRVVGRRGREHASLEQGLEYRHRERRTFIRIGAGADFIEQSEISALCLGERRDHVAKMRRERRERLRDGLLVADVGEDPPDHRKAAAVRGNRETARRHRSEQADRLQGDRLAAGVRTGHDEDAEVATELYVDADDVPLLDEQRVTRVDEIENAVSVQLGPDRLQ